MWRYGLQQLRVQIATIERLVIASPDQAGGPTRSLHGTCVVDRSRSAHHVARLLPLRRGDPPYRKLPHPVLSRENRQTRRPRIDGAIVDDPAILTWLGSIKPAGFKTHFVVQHDAGGDHFVSDVRRILPVMRKRGLRQLVRRSAMREGDRTECGVAHRRKIKLQYRVFSQRMRIVDSESHDEIVRVDRKSTRLNSSHL